MSARINLAPEVYQKHQRDKRNRRIATTVATTSVVLSAGFVLVMLLLLGAQKGAIALATNDIKSKQDQINNMTDLKKAATAQLHLNTWYELSGKQPKMSRFFAILEQFIPQGISVTTLKLEQGNKVEMNATAKSYSLINKMVKALEAANIEIGPNASTTNSPLFTDVQVTSASADQGAITFQLTATVASEVTSEVKNGN